MLCAFAELPEGFNLPQAREQTFMAPWSGERALQAYGAPGQTFAACSVSGSVRRSVSLWLSERRWVVFAACRVQKMTEGSRQEPVRFAGRSDRDGASPTVPHMLDSRSRSVEKAWRGCECEVAASRLEGELRQLGVSEREGPYSQHQDRRVRLMGEVAQGKIDRRREIPVARRELAALQR
jgi:hypothetical protein